ncbi:putative gustatory receptor 28a [Uranotaenia lowii]|uniref:putative gustatory receptor 28a n=1 Tax=Uranotaenia lowii TaxID=190385 RepID=UPI00247A505B|nr:putative gustatory receptor 28a [Uranotaenia lowii]
MPKLTEMLSIIWKFPKTNIYECMILHYLFLKLNGYACFTIVGSIESGKIRTSIFDWLLFPAYLALALGLWVANVWLGDFSSAFSPLMIIGNRMLWFMCYFCAVFGLFWNFLNRHKVWSLYTSVYHVDQQLLALGANMYYTRTYLSMIGFSLTGMLILLAYFIEKVLNQKYTLVTMFAFTYPNASLMMLVTIFSIAGSLVCIRLSALNQIISSNCVPSGDGKIIKVAEQFSIPTIQQYMQIYDQVCDITETVNLCYSGQIMIAIAGSFIYLLFYAFGTVVFIRRGISIADFPLEDLMWTFIYSLNIIFIVSVGGALKSQAQRTSSLIDQAINATKNTDAAEMLRLFLMQMGHRTPTLTCGLFPFDWSLVYSIVATSTTYLIILIQFENSRSG